MRSEGEEGTRRPAAWVVGVIAAVAVLLCVGAESAATALGAGDKTAAVCPNESLSGFASALPDCRAYEMASPAFAGGQRISPLAATADGSRVIAESLGTFADTENDSQSGSDYLLSRASSGWTPSPLSPPASTFPTEALLGADVGLGRTLWAARRASQSIYAEDLYIRETDGLLHKVGSMVPPSAEAGPVAGGYDLFLGGYVYVGASSDLSHILFTIRGTSALWPGDTTAKTTNPSLYEYVGMENREPRLVGVNGEGRLISNCGTTLGFNELEAYNAVSASGAAVFFTAMGHDASACEEAVSAPAVSELYARLSGIETVSISEPSPEQCSDCLTEARAPAEFRGASEDGSKAFFTTEQELLPGANTENLYEYDFNAPSGRKITRLSAGASSPEVLGVVRVSEDGSHVYFVARGVLTSEPDRSLAPGHQSAVAGNDNLYLYERNAAHPAGRLSFVATVSEDDSELWTAFDVRPAQTTPDGRFLVFLSAADLTPGDMSSRRQAFLYDSSEQQLVRVSVGQQGFATGTANADSAEARIPLQRYQISQSTAANINLALSDNGDYVVFEDGAALTPEASDAAEAGAESIYLYRSTGTITNGNVYLLSDGTNRRSDSAVGSDRAGNNVFFQTADQLTPGDGNTQYDLYDARVGGGFPVSSLRACENEACHEFVEAPQGFATPPSTTLSAEGGTLPAPPATRPRTSPRPRQALVRALRRCRKLGPRRRRRCEIMARRRYARRAIARRSQAHKYPVRR